MGACRGVIPRDVFADLIENDAQERGRGRIEHGTPTQEELNYCRTLRSEFNKVNPATSGDGLLRFRDAA